MARTKNTARHAAQGVPRINVAAAKRALSTATSNAGVKKPRRCKPGTVALREIRKYQKSVDLLIRKRPFMRVVREIAGDIKTDLRFQSTAVEALQHAAEAYLVSIFEKCQYCAFHRNRITVTHKDFQLVQFFENGEYQQFDGTNGATTYSHSAQGKKAEKQYAEAKRAIENDRKKNIAYERCKNKSLENRNALARVVEEKKKKWAANSDKNQAATQQY